MSSEKTSRETGSRQKERPRRGSDKAMAHIGDRDASPRVTILLLQKLQVINLALSDGGDFQANLEKATALSASLLNAGAATLDIHSADGRVLFYPISHQLPQGLLSLRHLPRGEDLSWESIESGQSMLVNDYPSSQGARQEVVDAGVRAVLGVPAQSGKHRLGSLVFYIIDSNKSFDELDLALAQLIASQIGSEVQNRLLHQEVEQLRGLEPITNFYTQHFFSGLAQHDVERVFRYGGYISVIMVEVDNLAQINSFYGEGIMNQVLGEIARLWREKLRTSDVLGSFGQSRMLILLPEADRQKARLTAERMRREIETAVFNTDAGPVKLTASLGIASSKRGRKIGAEKLIQRAEQVLAAAIRSGRNQVAAWNPDSDED